MPDYKKMYHIMFNAATKAELLASKAERLATEASEILQQAQCDCEELYLKVSENPIKLEHIACSSKLTAGK